MNSHVSAPTEMPKADTAREQRPWHTPEDARGWRVLARGKRQPRRVAVSVMVEFDSDQSEWLSQEAERTGQDYDEIVKRLVDAQRTGSAGDTGRSDHE